MKYIILLLLLLASCVSYPGAVKTFHFEDTINQQKSSTGCYAFLPETGEVTLMSWGTCKIVIKKAWENSNAGRDP